jgi:integrase/recombinase XerD
MEDPIIKSFMRELRTRYLAPVNTVRAYGGDIRRLAGHLDKLRVSLPNATQEHLQKYLEQIQTSPLSKRTIARQTAALATFYGFVEERNLCRKNPAEFLLPPNYRTLLPTPAKNSEAESLVASTNTETLMSIRDRIVMEIVKSTGIRPFELVCLNREDVNIKAGTIRIAVNPKLARDLDIPAPLIEDLTKYLSMLGERTGPLIVNRFHKRTTTRTVNRIFNKYTQTTTTFISPRTLRHAIALRKVQEGESKEDIQRSLGFKNPVSAGFYYREIQRLDQGEEAATGAGSPNTDQESEDDHRRHRRPRPRRFFPSTNP